MSPTSYQAALPRVIPSLLSATLIIIPYSNGFVKRVRKVFLQRKQRMKTRLLTFFPESQQARQFTPLREGRQPRNRQARCSAHFNSRSSARGDLSEYRVRRILIISIHAPPRGATCRFQNSREAHIFQFTPLREGRHISRVRRDAEDLFQFTPLREGRQSVYYKVLEDYIFQFTPLREGRPKN